MPVPGRWEGRDVSRAANSTGDWLVRGYGGWVTENFLCHVEGGYLILEAAEMLRDELCPPEVCASPHAQDLSV